MSTEGMSTQGMSLHRSEPAPQVRLVHLGLGAFHRAHQVWYTQQADPAWGYASFAGRGLGISEKINVQDGLYTLVTRSAEGDRMEVITSLAKAYPATDTRALVELIAAPTTAVVTLTVTEAGYHLSESGELDLAHADVAHDIAALTGGDSAAGINDYFGPLATACGRIVRGLAARKVAFEANCATPDAADTDNAGTTAANGGIAVMSCDNISANGELTRRSVLGFAAQIDADLAEWIKANVTFPSTSIDRITPRTDEALISDVEAATGYADAVPVQTEPFASWVIEGDFPAGRPEWEKAGVIFVDDITEFERRKLWLLNGAHSLIAYYGSLLGYATVAEAIADARIRSRVEDLWDEAAAELTAPELEIPHYRDQLIERFDNPRIRHNLSQIAIDGATKQRMRARDIAKAAIERGGDGKAAAFSIATWIAYVLGDREIVDTRKEEIDRAKDSAAPVAQLIALLDDELAANQQFRQLVEDFVGMLTQPDA